MEDKAFGVDRMGEDTNAGELERDGIDVADDDDALSELDVELFGDFFADGAGGALAFERGQLLGRHLPILADVEDQIGIDGESREEILGFLIPALETGPGGDFLDAGERYDGMLV